MYVNYCKNKPDSTQLIVEHAGNYFDVSIARSCETKQGRSFKFSRSARSHNIILVWPSTGNSAKAPTGQLHLVLPYQASAENHQVSAAAEGNGPKKKKNTQRTHRVVCTWQACGFWCVQELLNCCEEGKGEIKDGLEVMLSVPKKANDAMHLSMLEGDQLFNR